FEAPTRVRSLLRRDGTFDLAFYALGSDETLRRLEVSTIRVSSDDPFLYHKTTNRGVYERARAGCDPQTDVILVNERGEITESTIANIAVRRQGQWITPHMSCGLLPGIMRAELLAEGKIAEGTIHVRELVRGEIVRCFNSVRGVFDVGLV